MIFRDLRSAEQQQDSQKLSSQLKQNPEIVQSLSHNQVPLSQLDTHPYMIQSWYQAYQNCIKCPGLHACKQKSKGYFDNLVDDGFLHLEKCACKYMKERIQERKHLNNFLVNDMPQKFETVDFEKIMIDHEKQGYIASMMECMQAANGGQGTYLYGNMGSGKTYLAACACNKFAKEGKKVAFIHYPTFTQRMVTQLQTGEYRNEIQKLMYAYFLVIDDIGAESVTEWNRDSILLPILNARYEKGLCTWFTSNEDFDSLAIHFRFNSKGKEEQIKSERIMERIRSMAKPVSFMGESRRKHYQ